MSEHTLSLANIVNNATQPKSGRIMDLRTHERHLENLLDHLFISKEIFKDENGNYAFPAKYKSFANFIFHESHRSGSLIQKLSSPKSKELTYEDKIGFYHRYLLWLKKELQGRLDKYTDFIPADAKIQFIEKVMSTFPDEMKNEKLHVIGMTDELFDINDKDALCNLYNQTFLKAFLTEEYPNMEEIIFLTEMIQKFLDYNLVLAECRLHAQIKEAITHASIIGINERASILGGLADDLCIKNNYLKIMAKAVIKNYKSSKQSNSSISNEEEDKDEDEWDSKATIIDGCLDLYTEVVYDQLITQYINDPDN